MFFEHLLSKRLVSSPREGPPSASSFLRISPFPFPACVRVVSCLLRQVESLRSMLQASREKNGVYMEPWRFDQMENTLAAQGNQVT